MALPKRKGRDRSVTSWSGCGMDVQGLIPGKTEFFSLPQIPVQFWGPHKVLSNMHSGSSLGIKRPVCNANHAPPCNVMLTFCATTLMPPYVPTRRGASLNTMGQLCHDLVCSLLCLVGKCIMTSCQPVLPEMKRATNTATWRVCQVCCINVYFDIFIAAVASLLIESDWGFWVQFFGLRPQSWPRFFVAFLSPLRNYGIYIIISHDLNIIRSADGDVKLSIK
jgi:hypothetical protein